MALVALLLLLAVVRGDEHDHVYKNGEQVVLWMASVGPYNNLQETYPYFSLPFCLGPVTVEHAHETLSEALQGIHLSFSGLDIRFGVDVPKTQYCEIKMDLSKQHLFHLAVANNYTYQIYIDDLLLWGVVGETVDKQDHIWTHKVLELHYNGNQIVKSVLINKERTLVSSDHNIPMYYEVNWKQSEVKFDERYNYYLDSHFFKHRIHWFSIFNSFMMVLFLMILVLIILLKTLNKDYARYNREEDMDDMEQELGDEYGWKQIHGDVFRPAQHRMFLSSLVGTGIHLSLTVLVVILLVILGSLYTSRGSILSTSIFVYSALSVVGGFCGGALYSRQGGRQWIKQMLINAGLFPTLLSMVAMCVNFSAISYGSTKSISFPSMLAVVCLFLFVTLPLTLIGTVLGKNIAGVPSNPCRVANVPRPIPDKKWFMQPWFITMVGGILPFGSIFIEMYFVFTSFWAYKVYYVYGFALLVFIMMAAVSSCVTIVCTYFLLNSEDYRWQWTSFLSGASTSVYVYIYSIYYFLWKTKMYGFFQTFFYFSYMAVFCSSLGMICGAFSYIGSSLFVRKIYAAVKID